MFNLELGTFSVLLGLLIAMGSILGYVKYSKMSNSMSLAGATYRRTKTLESETLNKSSRHFLFGLFLTLYLVFLLFNWSSYRKSDNELEDFFLNEELTIIPPKMSAAPPPPASQSATIEVPIDQPIVPVPIPDIVKVIEKPIEKIEEQQVTTSTNATVTNSTSTNVNSTSTDPNGKGTTTNTSGEEAVLYYVEQMPRFPGCENYPGNDKIKETCSKEKLRDYITKNLNYPTEARTNKIEGVVYVSFIVEKDGSINKVSVVKDPGYNLGDSAKKLVENMNRLPQKWTPAYQNGVPVRVRYTLPVGFKLNKTNLMLK